VSSQISDIWFETRVAAESLADFVAGARLRLGVTGLSRSGKTVFITSLVHHLTRAMAAGRKAHMPVFRAFAEGRIIEAHLDPQPDFNVPRFSYEEHLEALTSGEDRHWPQSTRRISELRVSIEFNSKAWSLRHLGHEHARLDIDIVDYPGEWLLDLPLLGKSYEQWSSESLALSRASPRAPLAAPWHAHLATLNAEGREDEQAALAAARLFTEYLRDCRDERFAMSLLPPGRFLMPGNLAGSPALTFAPLDLPGHGVAPGRSLWAMMRRRYEAYKDVVVRPFFRDHFARLDRQVVLVDALSAFNAGPEALHDLEAALSGILDCFRIGRGTLLSALLRPKIDRILFAATKADHLHHSSHDRLEAVLRRAVAGAVAKAEDTGADIDVVALAAVRATREAIVARGREKLPSILGTPAAGESAGGEIFDGNTEVATFPGDLPVDPEELFRDEAAFRGLSSASAEKSDFRFLRFRPSQLEHEGMDEPALPHIRLDRALQFLIGDKLQ
jgi:predicted YcjX-like family ATPase